MAYEAVTSSEVLWDGPLFADEIGGPQGLTPSLREQYDLKALRVIPAKSAMTGVVTIYFRPKHRQWALVRYAKRYRWIFEILLRQGMSGERRLIDNDFSPDDVAFLRDIVPMPDEPISPAVYDILWRAAPFPAHIHVVSAISSETVFTPQEIIVQNEDIDNSDSFVFERLVRSHLIERKGSGSHPNARAKGSSTSISTDLDAEYRVTPEGKNTLPQIVNEHERIFVRETFKQLLINQELDPESHLPDYADPSSADESAVESTAADTSPDRVGVLKEIEQELAAFTESADSSSASNTNFENSTQASPSTASSDKVETKATSDEAAPADPDTTSGSQDTVMESQPQNSDEEVIEDALNEDVSQDDGDMVGIDVTESEIRSAESKEASDLEVGSQRLLPSAVQRISELESTVAQLENRIERLEAVLDSNTSSTGRSRGSTQALSAAESDQKASVETKQRDGPEEQSGAQIDREDVTSILESYLRQHRRASRSKLRLHLWKELDHDGGSPRDVWEAADVDDLVAEHATFASEQGNRFMITESDPVDRFDIDPAEERSRSRALRAVFYWVQDQDHVTRDELNAYVNELDQLSPDYSDKMAETLWSPLATNDAFSVDSGKLSYRDDVE